MAVALSCHCMKTTIHSVGKSDIHMWHTYCYFTLMTQTSTWSPYVCAQCNHHIWHQQLVAKPELKYHKSVHHKFNKSSIVIGFRKLILYVDLHGINPWGRTIIFDPFMEPMPFHVCHTIREKLYPLPYLPFRLEFRQYTYHQAPWRFVAHALLELSLSYVENALSLW